MIRRTVATTTIVLAGAFTALLGAVAAIGGIGTMSDYTVWGLTLATTGLAAAVTGSACVYFAGRDLPAKRLSRTGAQWAWAATASLAAIFLASVWFFIFALIAPLVTAGAVRLATLR